MTDCVCEAGFYSANGECELAPPGSYAGRMRYYNCSDAQAWRLSFESVHVRARPPPGSRERVARGQFSGHYCLDGPRTQVVMPLSSPPASHLPPFLP